MRKYEFIYICDPGQDEAAVGESLERYVKLIRDHGGEVLQKENWGRRKFAYDINKKSEGSYVYIKMNAGSKTIEELNRALHFDEKVLRNLIVLDEDAEARNAAAARREGREGRDSRDSRDGRSERGDVDADSRAVM